MWERVKTFFKQAQPDATRDKTPGEAPLFHRFYKFPEVFTFSLQTLDLDLLVLPPTGATADRDSLLLLVFGYQVIFKAPSVNEAYICRKYGGLRDRARTHQSFEGALDTVRGDETMALIETCLADRELERVDELAGGSLRLGEGAFRRCLALATAMNERLTQARAEASDATPND